MKKDELKKAVTLVARASARSGTRPILSGILLGPQGLRATDLDKHLGIKMPLPLPREVLVKASELKKALTSLKGKGDVELTLTDAGDLRLVYGPANIVLRAIAPVEEFPIAAEFPTAETVSVFREDLLEALQRVLPAATTDETRFQMHSVLFQRKAGSDKLLLVTTDGKRMSVADIEAAGGPALDAIVQLPAAEVLVEVLKTSKDERVKLRFDDKSVGLELDDVTLTGRLVEGRYPEYQRAIPETDLNFRFVLPVDETLQAVQAAALATTKETCSVQLDFGKPTAGRLRIAAQSAANGDSAAEVEIDGADSFRIFFNPGYLKELLETVKSDRITVEFRDRKTAGLFYVDGFKHIIMPLVVQEPIEEPAGDFGN